MFSSGWFDNLLDLHMSHTDLDALLAYLCRVRSIGWVGDYSFNSSPTRRAPWRCRDPSQHYLRFFDRFRVRGFERPGLARPGGPARNRLGLARPGRPGPTPKSRVCMIWETRPTAQPGRLPLGWAQAGGPGTQHLFSIHWAKIGRDCSLVWKDIGHSINNMYNFYDSQFKNKQSSQPASSSKPKSSLLSGLLSASKRSRS